MKMNPQLSRRLLLGGLAVALLAALAWVALRTGPLAPTKVQVTEVKKGSVSPAIFGIGQVEAQRSWMVGPTVAGRVLGVQVDVGQTVQPGQPLAEMDPVDLDQRLAALDASLARAQSAQQASGAQVVDAQARRALAAANLKRNEDLARQNFISAGALEARSQEVASANAGVAAAQANLGGTAQDITRLRAERAALAQQRGNLRLVAPAAAVVTARDAEAGTTVVAGQAVLRLMDPASLWVKLRVDQGRSAGLVPGLAARITLRSRPGDALAGKVARVEPLADSVTEERLAMVAFDALPAGVSVGEMAEVTLQLPATAESLLLPNAAVVQHEGQTGVWRLKDGALAFVPVTLGVQGLDGTVQVITGLDEGDTVVLYSQTALKANARIAVVELLLPTGAKK
ncbi:MAG TPA: efflux transporter periplasmic adaptor subunit [Hydrogenophaga sp.]|uniref:efflux RND transporter periplasmic adaptor subunit n=1 Tax=Hydrogenophaga sp. TaxID=1904254 RepID=UPI0008AF4C7A|nr:efflux RND transporter periplasmic adaptor subunit [Hydrogenophaga sp.]OGA75527.1 MAG: efflux transporter periplasmic adaptor subunit [Burkholderiales bacterium GWE1_65_30]OGA93653.1 MAG: efflux transporter periplasmic adaptor subunit [Burkholderiales bacterium GWF1_66_17]HAX20247.1 efflux transporter periplasmic adaptor subunit [Hydrogenophaga sp.]HBU18583.1 efflux transporter periplasmic adaptor subunit [Hydrogenophaga sp.]